MKAAARAALLLAALARAAGAAAVTPAQQVVNMLTEMKAKGKKTMEAEKRTYAAYAEWVDDRKKELAFEIKGGAAKIEELTASAAKADSDAATLGREIAALDAEVAKLQGEKAAATENRKAERAEYVKLSRDYSESVDALQRAIQVLGAEDYDREQAESMLQKMSKRVAGMPRVLAAFVQEERGRSSLRGDGAPAAAAYGFQSRGIVEVLEDLLEKFRRELAGVEAAESTQAHEFALVELHLANTIAKDTADRGEKAVARGKREAESAKAKGELASAKVEKLADEKLKLEIETTFAAKSATFEENQAVRKQELEAIGKAIEIVGSPEVAGSYARRVSAPSERPASLLQVARGRRRAAEQREAAELLSRRAGELRSASLAEAAGLAADGPFAKVIGMIESLLEKLKEEAAAEADHKAWCDDQLQKNKLKRNKKTSQVGQLTSEIEGQGARAAEMGAAIERLAAEQADLTKAMAEATEQRQSERAENEAVIKDAAAGAEAVKRAIVILKEFYAGQEASLLQRQAPGMEAYSGMQGSRGGVIGILEVIETDFARLKSETQSAEATAARQHDSFIRTSEAAKKAKHEEEVQLRLDKDQLEFERSRSEKELRSTQAELDKATEYFGFLKPSCVQVHVSWEDRAKLRKQEIEALKQAYAILDRKSQE